MEECKEECKNDDARVTKRMHAEDKRELHHMILMSLPVDLIDRLTMMILLNDTKGSLWARTCKIAHAMFLDVSKKLAQNGFAWWIGTGPPYRPSAPPFYVEAVNLSRKLGKFCRGMEVKDLERITQGWLTNFSIDAILLALHCPIICPGRPYVAQPNVAQPLVLSAGLGELHIPALNREFWPANLHEDGAITFPKTSLWGCDGVLKLIRNASSLIVPFTHSM